MVGGVIQTESESAKKYPEMDIDKKQRKITHRRRFFFHSKKHIAREQSQKNQGSYYNNIDRQDILITKNIVCKRRRNAGQGEKTHDREDNGSESSVIVFW